MLLKGRLFKIISVVVLTAFLNVILQPAIAAVNPNGAPKSSVDHGKPTAMERYGKVLSKLEAVASGDYYGAGLDYTKAKALAARPEEAPGIVRQLIGELKALEPEVDAEWKETEAHLKRHGIAQEILDRHYATKKKFKSKQAELKKLTQKIEAASRLTGQGALESQDYQNLAKFLKDGRKEVKRRPIDPAKLPFRSPDRKVREPIEEGGKLKDFLAGEEMRAFEEKEGEISGNKGARSGQASGLKEIVAPMATRELLITPGEEDLSETIDVQITQAVRDKATELGGSPVAIYEWVKNNIRFIPTYGSIQGSDMTLQMMRGNAFDIASLLIALLRSSGIPARYVYGTIELPADKAMNWVGGVTKPEAAQDILGQGGIPNVGLATGDQVTAIRMEHVWVEAWVDYIPSRGARNIEGDTWIPLDPSFKQFTYKEGIDFKNNVPFDAESFIEQATEGATINEQEGWVQNLNRTAVTDQFNAYVNEITAYLDQNSPDPTVGDLIGAQTIISESHPILLGTLPYHVKTTATKYSTLPDSLRHKFRYTLSGTWTYTEALPKLAGKKLTLGFIPATKADQDLIESYLPKPHSDGTPIQPNEFPRSLPAYIRVISQLRVEGEVVASGGVFSLGTELSGWGGFTQYSLSRWDMTSDYSLIAGQATAIGLSIQGVSRKSLERLKERMEQTKTKLDSGDVTGLTGDQLTGDMLTACIWGYLANLEIFGRTIQARSNMIDLPGLSYGLFDAKVIPIMTWYGVTTSVRFPGLEMDVGHLRDIRVAKDGSREPMINYSRIRGQHGSAMEALTPVKLFTDSVNPGEGISAATAIGNAAAQGQKIFTITQTNQAVALPQITQSAGVMEDIQNALAQGMEVTISERPITCGGWTGAGYIIFDPDTGAGAYLIEGGTNGGWLTIVLILAFLFLMLLLLPQIIAYAIVLGSTIIPLVNIISAVGSLIGIIGIFITAGQLSEHDELRFLLETIAWILTAAEIKLILPLGFWGGFLLGILFAYLKRLISSIFGSTMNQILRASSECFRQLGPICQRSTQRTFDRSRMIMPC